MSKLLKCHAVSLPKFTNQQVESLLKHVGVRICLCKESKK